MNESERSALLLAARLLETGMSPSDTPAPPTAEGPMLGVYLASRLARVADGFADKQGIAAALRSAAAVPADEMAAAA